MYDMYQVFIHKNQGISCNQFFESNYNQGSPCICGIEGFKIWWHKDRVYTDIKGSSYRICLLSWYADLWKPFVLTFLSLSQINQCNTS